MSLHSAVEEDDFEAVQSLFERQGRAAAINEQDSNGRTPLHIACTKGNVEIVAWLLTEGHSCKEGLLLDARDRNGETPLHVAARHGHLVVCQLLLNNGAHPAMVSNVGDTPIHMLARTRPDKHIAQNLALVEIMKSMKLRAQGLCVSEDTMLGPNDQGSTPLHLACEAGNGEVVRMLLGAESDDSTYGILGANSDGDGPLHLAVKGGHAAIVRLLVQHHQRVLRNQPGTFTMPLLDVTGSECMTVREMAVEAGHSELIALIDPDEAAAIAFGDESASSELDSDSVEIGASSASGDACHFIEHAKPRPAASSDPMDDMGSAPGADSPPMHPHRAPVVALKPSQGPYVAPVAERSALSSSEPARAVPAVPVPRKSEPHSEPRVKLGSMASESELELREGAPTDKSRKREVLGLVQRCNLLSRVYPSSEYELTVIATQVSEIPLQISFSPHLRVSEALSMIFKKREFARTPTSMLTQLELAIPPRSASDEGIVWMGQDLFLWEYDLKSGDVLSLRRKPADAANHMWVRVLVPRSTSDNKLQLPVSGVLMSSSPARASVASASGNATVEKNTSQAAASTMGSDANAPFVTTVKVRKNSTIRELLHDIADSDLGGVTFNPSTSGLYLCTNSFSESGHIYLKDNCTVAQYDLRDMDVVRVGGKPLFEIEVHDALVEGANTHAAGSCDGFQVLGSGTSLIDRQTYEEELTVSALSYSLALVVSSNVDHEKAGLYLLHDTSDAISCVEMPKDDTTSHVRGHWLSSTAALGQCLRKGKVLLFGERGGKCIARLKVTRDPFDHTQRKPSRFEREIDLLPGEEIVSEARDVTCYTVGRASRVGWLIVSNARFLFVYKTRSGFIEVLVDMPLATIGRLQLVPDKPFVDVSGRNLRTVRFAFGGENGAQVHMYNLLDAMAFPRFPQELFAFFHKPEIRNDGWKVYDIVNEFQRQMIPSSLWRYTHINTRYEMSDTYPPLLMVPANVSDEQLRPIFSFRSKGRIPVLVYYHHNGASITRSSQPMVGLTQKRCLEDEDLLTQVRLSNSSNPSVLYIFDARPMKNAIANTAMGMGYERVTPTQYKKCKLEFLNVENIHVMRESLHSVHRLSESSAHDDKNWFSQLDGTNWLVHIKLLLIGAVKITKLIDRDAASVLVHCSDGWDRTPQLTALVQLFLNPYYRTVIGFEVLLEKEWLSFGHKFDQRIGFRDRNYQDSQRAPIFLQFIDCVWQCVQQFPCSFEFSEKFLICILDHLYSCYYGTFLFNTAKEREYANIASATTSLWSEINGNLEKYTNPFYLPGTGVLYPRTHYDSLSLWRAYYCRWSRPAAAFGVTAELRCWQLILNYDALKERVSDLEKQLEEAKERNKQLEQEKAVATDEEAKDTDGSEGADGQPLLDGENNEANGDAIVAESAEEKDATMEQQHEEREAEDRDAKAEEGE